jgi:transglutaminase-like putative cysteine protease
MNRSVTATAVLLLPFLGVVAGVPRAHAENKPAAASAPATRTFAFTYSVTVPKPAAGAKHLDAWVPTPLEDQLQKVEGLKVSAKVDGKDVPFEQTKDAEYGNTMVHVGLDAPAADLVITWTATITRAADEGQGTGPMHDRFKQADNLVPLDGKAATLAKELGADKADADVAARAKTIYDEVLTTMGYSKDDKLFPGWGKGDFNRACEVGKGNCTDFHAKFTGIARAGGIPVRFTMGIPLSTEAKGTAGGYHCWAHWHDGKAWKPVDISEAQKISAKDPAKAQWFFGHLDPDRLSLSVGRDLTLSPKQAGKPLLFFAYPYVEVDGVETKDPKAKENRAFTWENR